MENRVASIPEMETVPVRTNRAATVGAVVFAVATSLVPPVTTVAHAEERQPAETRTATTASCADGTGARINECHSIGHVDHWNVVHIIENEYLLQHRATSKCLATDGESFLLHWCSPNIAIERWRLTPSGLSAASYRSVVYPEVCVGVHSNRV